MPEIQISIDLKKIILAPSFAAYERPAIVGEALHFLQQFYESQPAEAPAR